ncbi:MAG: molybdopterin cofactor-binding domain-containing protein [Cytophagales bacterium]|nr:molybdopterin cofactor-binding domain-containing protein [Cytophagales bacterium]
MTLIKEKYNRRSFMKVSTMAGGGIMLGVSWLQSCAPEQAEVLGIPETWVDMNAFIKIGDNGVVTIYSPNPEIGQNVKTSMPMIIAEELDVDWKNVVVEQAPYDISKYTRQLAGGSQSIRQGWTSLRTAGATVRRMLMEAAAKEWQVPVGELTTENGVIKHSSGKSIGYGAVASAASGMEVPQDVKLKDPKDFKIIGQSKKNVDAPKIVTGQPLYGIDIKREGMQIAAIVHPPAFGMKVKSVDDTAARAVSGITDVVIVNTEPAEKQWSDTNAFTELVAVVGKSTWQVMKAKKALKIEWTQDTPAESTIDHNQKLASALAKSSEAARENGNPGRAFANAAQVVEREYSAPFLAHNTMEPMNFFADVKEGSAELVGPIQTPEYLSKSAASLLGIPEENISIDMTRMGGGFGRRLYGHFALEAAAISQKVGTPIKMVYTREDDMAQGTYRPAYQVKYRAALDANNKMTALHVKGSGIHGSPVFADRFPAGSVDNYLAENEGVESNISAGAWRAPRSNFMAGIENAFLDEVAEAAGKDPIDFRLELFDRAINDPIGERNDYDPKRYAGVLEEVKKKANWGTATPGVHRGVSAYYCHNSYVAQVLDIEMKNGTPRVKKVWCVVDCGVVVNPGAAKNQIEGGIVDGIGHAMYGQLTFKDGAPEQQNFDRYRLIRQREAPLEIETFFINNGIDPTGLGEPSLPPIMGALANALYKATGERFYNQPFIQNEIKLG